MIFSSDNWAGAHPAISAALNEAAGGFDPAYGTGEWDKRVAQCFNEIFERDVAVFFVATGTAANSLALASQAKPGGVVFASHDAHILTDESGAPEYLTGGSRVRGIDGPNGKLDAVALEQAIQSFKGASVHAGQPGAVSVTQAGELGTLYSLAELDAISSVAKTAGIPMHMDGARFANALVALGCSAAEMTWKRGVDMLSFGGTKNGCWCAEAVIFFDPAKTEQFPFYRMRAGQLHSKSRFIAAQFEAYFANDLWLENARHANAMTARLAALFERAPHMRLAWRPEANEAFVIMPESEVTRLQAAGARFYAWNKPAGFNETLKPDQKLCRFVTSFATSAEQIDAFAKLLHV